MIRSIVSIACRFHRQLVRCWLAPILFYRKYLSALKGYGTCRYLPTCSEYAIESVESFGIFVGTWKTIGRLLRCNPFFREGYDPVQVDAKSPPREK